MTVTLSLSNLVKTYSLIHGTARSIPRLVAFSGQGKEYFQWGPRPREAQHLRQRLKSEGLSSDEISQKLIEWYDDGGWRQVDDELTKVLKGVVKAV